MRLAILLGLANLCFPQSFEVASIREATAPGGVRGGCHGINSVYTSREEAKAPPQGQCVIATARLSHLIGIAYGVTMQNLNTGPDWIQRGDLRFNVQAKAEDPKATEQQLLKMLQNPLVERFQLKFHYDTTQVQGFALTVGKSAPKLQTSQADEASMSFRGPSGEAILKPLPNQPISLTLRKATIADLASLLTQLGATPIVDNTDLTGKYDFTLSWDENAGPSLPTAIREQLGLSLESKKVPVSTFVVDAAQKPSAN